MPQVFISYSHTDGKYAHRLAKELKTRGIDVWIDDRIDYGDQWPRVIQDNLSASRIVLVIMTPNAYDSMWVQNEVSYAQGNDKVIFPVLLEGKVWLQLASMQYVNVQNGEMPPDKFFEKLRYVLDRSPAKEIHPNKPRGRALPTRKQSRFRKLRTLLIGIPLLALAGWLYYGVTHPRIASTPPSINTGNSMSWVGTAAVMTEAQGTSPTPFPSPLVGELVIDDYPIAVGDVHTYKYGYVSEQPNGTSSMTEIIDDVTERVTGLEEGSNEAIQIYRVERSGAPPIGLDCAVEENSEGIQTLWYIVDGSRLFVACTQDEREQIMTAWYQERLIFSATPAPELSTPFLKFPITLGAKWSRWADTPPRDDDGMYVWIVESTMDEVTTLAGTFTGCFRIALHTNPDVTIRVICKDVGLVSWLYHHIGSLQDYSGELSSLQLSAP